MPTLKSYTFASHTSQPTSQSLQKSMPFQPHRHRHSNTTDRQTTKDRRAACNMRLASCGVKCLNSSAVFQINLSAGLAVLCLKSHTNATCKNVMPHC